MSTTQNQTLQDKLLEIEKEVKNFGEKYPFFQKLESALSNAELIAGWIGYLVTVSAVLTCTLLKAENFNFWVLLWVLIVSFYPGFIAVFIIQAILEKPVELLIYWFFKSKISKEQFDELGKLKTTLTSKKGEIQKKINYTREQAFEVQLNNLRQQLTNRIISLEEAKERKQRLETECSVIVRAGGYQIYTSKWYSYLFDCINESLKNYHQKPETNPQPRVVEKADTSGKISQIPNNRSVATEPTQTLLSRLIKKSKQIKQQIKPSISKQYKPKSQVSEPIQPNNSGQKPDKTVDIKPLSEPKTDSNNKPLPSQKLVPTTKSIPGEKKSTSTGDVKTVSEPIIERREKTPTTSISGKAENVTPVQSKSPIVPEEKTLAELFGEQPESEQESSKEPRQSRASVKTDYLKLNEHRHIIGERGEEFVLELEKSKLATGGFKTLSEQVVHVSKRDDSKGYDILSFFEDGREKYIEVKTTTEDYNAAFYLSESEMRAMDTLENYFIHRIYNFNIETCKGKYFIIDCKNKEHDKYYKYEPVSYRVSPKF